MGSRALGRSFSALGVRTGPGSHLPTVGEHRSIEHTFSQGEVREFAEASADRGKQHITPDAQGPLVVHGLLMGTLPTMVGGQLNFLTREMTRELVRPVFTGKAVRCGVVLTRRDPSTDRIRLAAGWECVNDAHVTVMRGRASGIVRSPAPPGDDGLLSQR